MSYFLAGESARHRIDKNPELVDLFSDILFE